MPRRLRFQSTEILYKIVSDLKFDSGRGNGKQVTYYGGNRSFTEAQALNEARKNIAAKFLESGGRLISLRIIAVYK